MPTYCILGSNGSVLTTFQNSQLSTNQNGYTEIPVDGGQVGQVWNGTAFVAGPTPVPQTVSAAQMMMALSQQMYYSAVTAYVSSLPVAEQFAFNRAGDFERNDPLINSLSANVPLTSAQIDALFIAAAAVTV
ncbi:hypothetical protein [Paraburkholderia sp. RL18-085-BIA-A]|uniref:hypothetical protein n=1 Tax=Paraburkholderia sp. RL18-085-BIA-A TaxID=3031633 RepID=UPI0038BC141B